VKKKLLPFLMAFTLLTSIVFAEQLPYSTKAHQSAIKNNDRYVLDFYAKWCGTCRKQHRTISKLQKQPQFNDLKVFTVNYDTEKALRKQYRVQRQSTLIGFLGEKEITRKMGITSLKNIGTFFAKVTNTDYTPPKPKKKKKKSIWARFF